MLIRIFGRLSPALRPWAVWFSRLVIALLVVALLLPLVLRAGLHYGVKQQQLQLQLDGLYFNLFSGYLAVSGLQLSDAQQPVLRIDRLALNLAWLELLASRLELESLELSGGRVLIDHSEQLLVAGINLSQLQQQSAVKPAASTEPLAWGLSNIRIDELQFDLRWPHWRKNLQIESLSIDRLSSWQLDRRGLADLRLRLAEGQLRLNLQLDLFSDQPEFVGSVEIEALQLRWLNDWLVDQDLTLAGALEGSLSFSYPLQTEPAHYLIQGDLGLDQLQLRSPAKSQDLVVQQLQLEGLAVEPDRVQFKQLQLQQLSDRQQGIDLQQLQLNQFKAQLTQQLDIAQLELQGFSYPEQRLGFERLLLSTLAFDFNDRLTIEQIDVDQLFKPRSPLLGVIDDMDVLLKIPEAQISRLQLQLPGEQTAGALQVGRIVAADGEFFVAKTAHAVQQNQQLEAAQQTSSPTADQPQEVEAGSGRPAVAFQQIDYRNFKLSFVDTTIEPEYQIDLDQFNLSLGPFDTQQPQQATSMDLQARLPGGGSLVVDGQLQLAAVDIDGRMTLAIEAFDTRYGNYVVPRLLGHRITQGHLDLSVEAEVKQGYLKSENNLVLHKVEVRPLNEQEAKLAEGAVGLPLGMALSLLSDDGKVDLDVPLEGPLDQLNVGLSDAISTVLYNSVGKAVLAYYSPLGMVFGAFKVAGYVTKARFEPIRYQPQQLEPDPQQQALLANVVQLLAEQPELKLVVCPSKGEQELQGLLATAASNAIASVPAKQDRLMQVRLTRLAELLAEQGLDPKRLIRCELPVQPEPGPSKVVLAI